MQLGRNEAKGTSHRRKQTEEMDKEDVTGDEIHKLSSSCPGENE